MTQEKIRRIEQSWLFRKMKREAALEAIERLEGQEKRFQKGQILLHEGDVISRLGILLSGEVRISRVTFEGEENLFQKLEEGYLYGADVVCTPTQKSPYTAYCSEEAGLWIFDYKKIKEPGELPEHLRFQLQERLLEFIANENIRKFYKLDMLSSRNAKEKILKYLNIQKRKKKNGVIEIPYDREELANYLCMNRSVLSHTLSLMRQEGILEFQKNRFFLKEEP